MRLFLSALIGCLLLSTTIFSQEAESKDTNTESWYFNFGLGYSKTFYPSSTGEIVDEISNLEDVTRSSLFLDLMGFYKHIAPKTIAGIIFNGATDSYRNSDRGKIQINLATTGFGIMHFIGRDFGSGIFARGDIGLGMLAGDIIDEKEYGLGILVGGGWSFDLGGTRLLLNANYTLRVVESGDYHTLGFSIGGLF